MIIAFYPGAGGNRYLRQQQGLEWQQPGVAYDHTVMQQLYQNRYLLGTADTSQSTVLTHCMNTQHLQHHFPEKDIVFIIGDLGACLQREWVLAGHDRFVAKQDTSVADRLEHYAAYKDRAWPECATAQDLLDLPTDILAEVEQDFARNIVRNNTGVLKELENQMLNKVNSAYEIIKWHQEYYTKYPVDLSGAADVVDIRTHNDIFSTVMREELTRYTSEIFNTVWNKLNE